MKSNRRIVFIGIGSNLGDRVANCKEAIKRLKDQDIGIIKVSSFYETEPYGLSTQNWYVNCVVKGHTPLSPEGLLSSLQDIEKEMGRKEKGGWLPRTIDLDILFYDNLIVKEEGLTIPHPLLASRRFVLQPLVEVEPAFVHPVLNKTIEELYKGLRDKKKVLPILIGVSW